MNRFSAACVAGLLGSALTWTAAAQGPKGPGEAPPASGESLAAWAWRQELSLPRAAPGQLLELTVPAAVFDKAGQDLADLRLADADGKPVPYALRVRRRELRQVPVAGQRPFNRTTNAAGKYAELSLALGEGGPVLHNEVEVTTAGNNFRRAVQVFGSDSDQLDKAEKVADRYVVRYEVEGKVVDVRKVHYDLSRYRYLKVRVRADPSANEEAPKVENVIARRTASAPGVYQTLAVALGQREDVRGDGGPGSAWMIELPGGGSAPWERLSFDVVEDAFVRPYRLESANPDEPRQVIARGDWRRGTAGQPSPAREVPGGGPPAEGGPRPAGEHRPMEIELPREVFARRLRLVVTDFSNPPLTVTGARSVLAARQVVFELARGRQYPLPLRLYFGSPSATLPHYDFARGLPARSAQQAAQASLIGQAERNPAYQPPPLPLSERWPWLIYVVLGAASLVLLGILALLARQAVARHDAAQPSAQASPRPE